MSQTTIDPRACWASKSDSLASQYMWRVILFVALCRASGIQPSILLHPLDFIGREEAEGVEFFPGMSMPSGKKLSLVDFLLDQLRESFRVVTIRDHAIRADQETNLPVLKPCL